MTYGFGVLLEELGEVVVFVQQGEVDGPVSAVVAQVADLARPGEVQQPGRELAQPVPRTQVQQCRQLSVYSLVSCRTNNSV